MNTLFPIEPIWPPGFSYHPHFITEEEETQLLERIKDTTFTAFTFQGYEAKRRVASFGYDWNFEKQSLSKGQDIPAHFNWLIEKVAQHLNTKTENFSELLVTEYPPGAVINWHRDAPPFDTIAGISLLSDCIFKLKPHDKAKQNRKSIVSLPVQRRSLYIMAEASRSEWQHSINPVQNMRYSITLRTLNTHYAGRMA